MTLMSGRGYEIDAHEHISVPAAARRALVELLRTIDEAGYRKLGPNQMASGGATYPARVQHWAMQDKPLFNVNVGLYLEHMR
jgi:hypothetical protein